MEKGDGGQISLPTETLGRRMQVGIAMRTAQCIVVQAPYAMLCRMVEQRLPLYFVEVLWRQMKGISMSTSDSTAAGLWGTRLGTRQLHTQ